MSPANVIAPEPDAAAIESAAQAIARSQRPLLLVGSQALAAAEQAPHIASAVDTLGLPVYLSGMARGLLGRHHARQYFHQRRQALRDADCVILAGVPCDFRLDYGSHVRQFGRAHV